MLREKALALNPEKIILVFYFNDLGSGTGFLDDFGILRPEGWEPSKQGKTKLLDRSAFYKAFKKVYDLRASKKNKAEEQQKSEENPQEDSVTNDELRKYSRELNKFAALVPNIPKYFVIWPDQELHEPSRVRLKTIAKNRGFKVIDLYETFSNKVPTLPWDTVHPGPEALEEAAGKIVQAI